MSDFSWNGIELHDPQAIRSRLVKATRLNQMRSKRLPQAMLDFCGEHGIVADIETIRLEDINTAFERILTSDVRYRFVVALSPREGS